MPAPRIARTSKHGELHLGHVVLLVLGALLILLCTACSSFGSGTHHAAPQDTASDSAPPCQPSQQAAAFLRTHQFERLGTTTLVLRVVQPATTSFVADDVVVYYGQLTCEFEVGIAAPHRLGEFALADVAHGFAPYTYNGSITYRALYLLSFMPVLSPDQKNDECVTHTAPTLALVKPDMVTAVALENCQWLPPRHSKGATRPPTTSELMLAG